MSSDFTFIIRFLLDGDLLFHRSPCTGMIYAVVRRLCVLCSTPAVQCAAVRTLVVLELGNAWLARGKEGHAVTVLEGRGGGRDKLLVVTGPILRLGPVLHHWCLSGGTPTG